MQFARTDAMVDYIPRHRLTTGARPALTQLALLMCANPDVAARVLRDPANAATAHPQYALNLDEYDRATLCAIQSRTHTLRDFISELAVIADGQASQTRD